MITPTGKYYLYRHVRIDKNEPFYIGIGTKQSSCTYSEYMRSRSTTNRKVMWKNIVAKTDYEVEILLESDDYEFIKQKEIEFIALYGRRDLDKGTLVNHTDGGEGTFGRVVSEETRENIRKSHKGKRSRGDNHNARKVINVITKEVFSCAKDVSEKEGIRYSTFRSYLNGALWNKTDFMYLKDYEKGFKINENTKAPPPVEREYKFIDTVTGEKYKTIQEIADKINYSHCYTHSMISKGTRKNKTNIVPL